MGGVVDFFLIFFAFCFLLFGFHRDGVRGFGVGLAGLEVGWPVGDGA